MGEGSPDVGVRRMVHRSIVHLCCLLIKDKTLSSLYVIRHDLTMLIMIGTTYKWAYATDR